MSPIPNPNPNSNSLTLIKLSRRFLQASDIDAFNGIPKSSHSAAAAAARRPSPPLDPNPAFDSSMALTILVLLTALFFLGFFSIYIRRFASASAVDSAPPPSAASRKCGGGGLDRSAVDSLPVVAYGGGAKHRMIEECAICLGELSEGETVKLIPRCGHVFHPGCVDTWLASHVTCPLCRSADLFDEICLDVAPDTVDDCRAAQIDGERSCHGGVRRACSYSDLLANHAVLHRSTSF